MTLILSFITLIGICMFVFFFVEIVLTIIGWLVVIAIVVALLGHTTHTNQEIHYEYHQTLDDNWDGVQLKLGYSEYRVEK